MNNLKVESWVLFSGNIRTGAQKTVSQVTSGELTPKKEGRGQTIYRFAARGRQSECEKITVN